MSKLLQILCLCVIFPAISFGQFNDNFSDGEITSNPTWQGDVDKFIVNVAKEMQLDDTAAGSATVFLPISITPDFTWEMDLLLNFNPSDNNMLRVYFFIDNSDISSANGYYLEIGENLAEDNVKIYRLDSGVSTLMQEGEGGALAQKPAQISLRINRVEGLWSIGTDYEKLGFPVEEFSFFDDTYDFITDGFFVFETKYTSSNSKEFYLDNLSGSPFVPDTEGPMFVKFENQGTKQVLLTFNEPISITSLDNLTLDVSPQNILVESEITGAQENQVLLTFNEDFQSGPTYAITVSGLEDEEGNVMLAKTFNFVLAVGPELGDLVINEILFNPLVDGSDFIELLNKSDKVLQLQGLELSNNTKEGSEEFINVSIIILPEEIIAFSADTSDIINDYTPPSTARLHELKIPTLNADEGNVTVRNNVGDELDSYNYSEDDHLALLDEVKGVSLERIFANSPSESINFASGVKSSNYATPGYTNKNTRISTEAGDDIFAVESQVFSPNGDGDQDQLIMLIQLPESGYLSTIRIFDIEGRITKVLTNNEITGVEDIARWDGIMEDGGRAPIGHYIVVFEAFKDNGAVLRAKRHVKLLDFF